jgi:hypothetical protein
VHRLDDFRNSLDRLGLKSITYQIEVAEKRVKEIQSVITALQKGQKIPYLLSYYKHKTEAELEEYI